MQMKRMDKILKHKIKEQVILDRSHQHVIAALNQKVEHLEKELTETKNIDKNHQRINGLLHLELDKYKKQNEELKKENQIIREGNQALGIYRQENDPSGPIRKLLDSMIMEVKVGTGAARRHPKNIMFIQSMQSLARHANKLKDIYDKLTKKN